LTSRDQALEFVKIRWGSSDPRGSVGMRLRTERARQPVLRVRQRRFGKRRAGDVEVGSRTCHEP
jgi:hypothetical protein